MKKRLGEILLERQLLTVDQLNTGLAHQRQWNMRLGAALVAKGFITERDLTHVLSESLGIPMVDLSKVVVDRKALAAIPVEFCEHNDLFPIALKQQRGRPLLLVAMADPLNFAAIDELAFSTGCKVQPAIALLSTVGQAIRRFYYEQRGVEITPLDPETPLSRSGKPIIPSTEPIELSSQGLDGAAFLAEVERPELGGPGQSPAGTFPPFVPPPPRPPSGSTQRVFPTASWHESSSFRDVTVPFLAAEASPSEAPPASADGVGGPLPPPSAPIEIAAPPSTERLPPEALAAMDNAENYDHLPLIELCADAESGTFAIVVPSIPSQTADDSAPPHPESVLHEPLPIPPLPLGGNESLEEKFWALMRVLNARGLVTKEEYLAQLSLRR